MDDFIAAGSSLATLLSQALPGSRAPRGWNCSILTAMLSGLGWVPAFLLTGYRQCFPTIWPLWRWVLMLTLAGMLFQQLFTLW